MDAAWSQSNLMCTDLVLKNNTFQETLQSPALSVRTLVSSTCFITTDVGDIKKQSFDSWQLGHIFPLV